MNLRTTAILFGLAVVCMVVMWLTWPTEPTAAPSVETTTQTRYVLEPVPKPEQIVKLVVQRPGKPTLTFERAESDDAGSSAASQWRLTEPVQAPAESYMVSNLLTIVTTLQSRSKFSAGKDLDPADAGLTAPKATVQWIERGGQATSIEVGDHASLSEDTYVRVVGRAEIHLVGRDLLDELDHDVSDYRAKGLVQYQTPDVVGLQITHQEQKTVLTRNPDGQWVMDEPIRASADSQKVESLLGKIRALQATEFPDETNPTATGLESPSMTVSVIVQPKRPRSNVGTDATTQPAETQPARETITIAVGEFCDLKREHRYVRASEGGVAAVRVTSLEGIAPRPAELRDPRIVQIEADAVTKIELQQPGAAAVAIERSDGIWTGSGDLERLEAPAVADLVQAIEDTRAVDYVAADLAAQGLDQPYVLRVWTTGRVEPAEIRIGGPTASGRNTYVQGGGAQDVQVISAQQADRLRVAPLTLRSRTLVDVQPPQVREIEVTRGSSQFVVERSADGWQMRFPEGLPVDASAIQDLSNDLARLRAKQVVARDEAAAYGLDSPEVRIRFAVDVGSQAASQAAPGTEKRTADTQPAETESTGEKATADASTESEGNEQPADAAKQDQPASQEPVILWREVHVARHEGRVYAKMDAEPFVYELDDSLYRVFTSELIDRRLFDFSPQQVQGVRIEALNGLIDLVREADGWQFAPDPTVRLAAPKVNELVEALTNLRVESYVHYSGANLAEAGLADSPVVVTLRLNDGREEILHMEPVRRGESLRKAAWVRKQRVFEIRETDAQRLLRGLDAYLSSEPTASPQPAGM